MQSVNNIGKILIAKCQIIELKDTEQQVKINHS